MQKHISPNSACTEGVLAECNLREFVKTHVILAPARKFSRSRAASEIPFPRASRASRARRANSKFFILCVKISNYLRSRVIRKVKKTRCFLHFLDTFFSFPNRACTDRVLTVLSQFLGSPPLCGPGAPRSHGGAVAEIALATSG